MSQFNGNLGRDQKILLVKWRDVVPNPWNPNKMNERQFDAELESIMHNGFIDPVTVRENAANEGHEIIDGEHRWRALQFLKESMTSGKIKEASGAIYDDILGWRTAEGKALSRTEFIPPLSELLEDELLPVINLGVVSNTQAKKLTLILNETRGRADVVDKAVLLGDILKEASLSIEELQIGLPYKEKELNELIGLGNFDWDKFNGADDPSFPSESANSSGVSNGGDSAKDTSFEVPMHDNNVPAKKDASARRTCCPNCGHEF